MNISQQDRLWPINRRSDVGIVVLVVLVLGIGAVASAISRHARSGRTAQWGNVENVYQRLPISCRISSPPSRCREFRKEHVYRSGGGALKSVKPRPARKQSRRSAAFAQFQKAQDGLTAAFRVCSSSPRRPDLKANQNFLDLQSQLEGTENRIAVERMRFNETAQAFNTARQTFPTVIFANFFGSRFAEKVYFQSQPGAATAPKVTF